jgi:hypothetical protein
MLLKRNYALVWGLYAIRSANSQYAKTGSTRESGYLVTFIPFHRVYCFGSDLFGCLVSAVSNREYLAASSYHHIATLR